MWGFSLVALRPRLSPGMPCTKERLISFSSEGSREPLDGFKGTLRKGPKEPLNYIEKKKGAKNTFFTKKVKNILPP